MSDLIPKDCVNREQIPFITSRNNLHVREMIFQCDQFVIEDQIDSERKNENGEPMVTRQLRFAEHKKVCQSEVPIIYKNTKTSKQPISEHMQTESELLPPKKQRAVIYDRNNLAFEYQ